MVTKTLTPYPARRKHISATTARPPPMPPIPSKRSSPRTTPSGGPERSQRSGSAFASFSFPESRGPLRSDDALLSGRAALIPTTKANKHYVFVYGSLRRGHQHARLMDRATYIGEFRTVSRYPLVACGSSPHSPYLLDVPEKGSKVKGEVYAVDDALLADLDHLEKVGSHHVRKVTKVCSCSDRSFVAQAFVYFGTDMLDEMVERRIDGDSRKHQSEARYGKVVKTGGSSSGR